MADSQVDDWVSSPSEDDWVSVPPQAPPTRMQRAAKALMDTATNLWQEKDYYGRPNRVLMGRHADGSTIDSQSLREVSPGQWADKSGPVNPAQGNPAYVPGGPAPESVETALQLIKESGLGLGPTAAKGAAQVAGGGLLALKGHPWMGLSVAGRGFGNVGESLKGAWEALKAARSVEGTPEEFQQFIKNYTKEPQWQGMPQTGSPIASPSSPNPSTFPARGLPSGRMPKSFADQAPIPTETPAEVPTAPDYPKRGLLRKQLEKPVPAQDNPGAPYRGVSRTPVRVRSGGGGPTVTDVNPAESVPMPPGIDPKDWANLSLKDQQYVSNVHFNSEAAVKARSASARTTPQAAPAAQPVAQPVQPEPLASPEIAPAQPQTPVTPATSTTPSSRLAARGQKLASDYVTSATSKDNVISSYFKSRPGGAISREAWTNADLPQKRAWIKELNQAKGTKFKYGGDPERDLDVSDLLDPEQPGNLTPP